MNWYKGIDWNLTNDELAAKYGVSPRFVGSKRRSFFYMLKACWGETKKKYGVSKSHVVRMRAKYDVAYVPVAQRRKKKPRARARRDGRTASVGVRACVLDAIVYGRQKASDIHVHVLNTWGSVSYRTILGALSYLLSLKEIVYTLERNQRMYKRAK